MSRVSKFKMIANSPPHRGKITIVPRRAGKTTAANDLVSIAMRAAVHKVMNEPATAQTMLLAEAVVKGLEPWEQCPTVWKTKAAFFQWMRGQMRRAWSRHPVKVSYMHNHRKRVPLGKVSKKHPKGMVVWGCECEHCHKDFKQTECEVDHIEQAGSFKGWEDFEPWMNRLMHINWNSIRVVCKECHRIISYAERMKITFDEAKLEKEVIAFTKLSVQVQRHAIAAAQLALTTKTGAPMSMPMSNAKERRASMKKLMQWNLQEKLNGNNN